MKGLISSIQRYSLRDGPGIRTTVFLMGCNLNCRWCSNPELIEGKPKIMVFPQKCIGCGACINIDQDHALRLEGKTLSVDHAKPLDPFVPVCPTKVFEPVGEWIVAADLANQLIKDRLFYEKSGGGVTFSGGEPMLQHAFIKETAMILKSLGIDVAVDTAGCVDYEVFEALNPFVDRYLYDLKALDDSTHSIHTGQSNALILANLDRLIHDGKRIVLRMVLVKGINDSPQEKSARLALLNRYQGKIERIDLLAYHRLGVGKYAALGKAYPLEPATAPISHDLDAFAKDLRRLGFEVHLEQAI